MTPNRLPAFESLCRAARLLLLLPLLLLVLLLLLLLLVLLLPLLLRLLRLPALADGDCDFVRRWRRVLRRR